MDLQKIAEAMDKMSKEDLQAILDTEFDSELEKEASDNLAQADLENALYAYGAYQADLEVMSEEAGEEGLSKEASAEFETADQEISEAIESGIVELGLDNIEDDVELHKTAMMAATLIFEGYTDQMEKWAKESKKAGKGLKGLYGAVKKRVGHVAEKAKEHAMKAGKHAGKLAKKHGGKAGLVAGGAALAYGGMKAHEHMKKQSSELTAGELVDLTLSKQAAVEVIADGIEKLAARGAGKAGMLAKGMGHVKAFHKKHLAGHGKHMAAAGAAGAVGGGLLAHRMAKKDK
jgi:hypothetical protein